MSIIGSLVIQKHGIIHDMYVVNQRTLFIKTKCKLLDKVSKIWILEQCNWKSTYDKACGLYDVLQKTKMNISPVALSRWLKQSCCWNICTIVWTKLIITQWLRKD